MKIKRKLKGNCIVLTVRLQSAIEVHLFNKATFTHDEYSTDFSEWRDRPYNKSVHMFDESNLSIHKSGDIVHKPFFGIIGKDEYERKGEETGTYEEVQHSVDCYVEYLRTAMGV